MKKIFVCLGLIFIGLSVSAQSDIESRIDSVMARLSVKEKIGQLNQLDGRSKVPYLESLIANGQLGSIMNIVDYKEINRLQKMAMENHPHIPIVFSRDVVHGFRTMLPIPLGMAASFNPALVEEGSKVAAVEAGENGIRWGFGPMIDVSRDARWGRIAESFGEDILMNELFGVAVVRGYQWDDLSNPATMAACAKHFVGYSATEGGRDYNSTYLTERQLRDIYLPPFKAAVENGCASIMTSFNDNDGLPTSANPWLLKDVLRDEWGFDGVVVSDWGSVGELSNHGVAVDKADAARYGLNCGTDMEMSSKTYINHAEKLIEEGSVEMAVLDNAVRNVLRLKFRLGLFENPYVADPVEVKTGCQEHLDAAEKVVEESVVLLKNDGVLPLDKSVRTVLLTGPLADAPHDQLGTWTMDGDTTMTVTPADYFQKAFGRKVKVIYQPSLVYSRDKDTSSFAALREKATKADVIVACLGEEAILSGEAHCLSDIGLKGEQTALLEMLAATGKPVVSIFMAGRPMTIAHEVELSSAVLYAFHPGTMGGKALARIINGEVNPSGKLPVTFPLHVGQTPMYYSYKPLGRGHKAMTQIDDIPRNARQSVLGHSCSYLDTGNKPLFNFGFGLSYTRFELKDMTAAVEGDKVHVTATLSNVGERAGAEVVQLYICDVKASRTRPVKELKAFEKVYLEAGETRKVELEIPVSRMGFYVTPSQYVVEPGEFKLLLGTSSETTLGKTITL